MIARLIEITQRHDEKITSIALADTMGWATPLTMRRMIGAMRERWPDKRINLQFARYPPASD